MSNDEPRPSPDEPRLKGVKSFRCTFGPLHETDFVWPPPPADVEGRGVLLSDEAPPAEVVSTAPSPIVEPPSSPQPVSHLEPVSHPKPLRHLEPLSHPDPLSHPVLLRSVEPVSHAEPQSTMQPHESIHESIAEPHGSIAEPQGSVAGSYFSAEPQGNSADSAGELVWPPPAADLDACSVVVLTEADDPFGRPPGVTIEDFRVHVNNADSQEVEDDDTPTAELELPPSVLARLRAGIPPAAEPAYFDSPSAAVETPPAVSSTAPLVSDAPDDDEVDEETADQAMDEAPAPAPLRAFTPPVVERIPEPTRSRGNGLMWAAVLVALSGLAIGYSEFRAGRREAMQVVRKTAAPPAAATPAAPQEPAVTFEREPVPSAPEPVAAPEPVPEGSAGPRTGEPSRRREPEPEPEPVFQPRRSPEPTPAPRVILRSASVAPPPAAPAPASMSSPAFTPVAATAPNPVPTPEVALAAHKSIAEPVVHTAALESAADAATMAADEEHIESTLTRFRTAYSKLDARAAREVWPSVDVEALDRAFRGLKSQDLRFDRCDLTVDGMRARAACRGSAVYVPRVGNQSPKATAREWTFELKKSDQQRWTIASARSS